MSSVLTPTSPLNARSSLREMTGDLGSTQPRISNGVKVTLPKDSAAYGAVSGTVNAVDGMNMAISEGLALAKSSVKKARQSTETIVTLAREVAQRVAIAQTEIADHAQIGKELSALVAQMQSAIDQPTLSGENLIGSTTVAPTERTIISGVSRDGETLSTTEITFQTYGVQGVVDDGTNAPNTTFAGLTLTDTEAAVEALPFAEALLATVIEAAKQLRAAEKRIETQQRFLAELAGRLQGGVASMIDADMDDEATLLQALRMQQQVAMQSRTIAHRASPNILDPFTTGRR